MIEAPLLPNTTIKVYKLVESEETDEYGDPIIVEEFQGEYPADIQPASGTERNEKFGDVSENVYIIYAPSFAKIDDNSIIEVDDSLKLKVLQKPDEYRKFIKYKRVYAKKMLE